MKQKSEHITIGIPLSPKERDRLSRYCGRYMKKGAVVREAILAYLDSKEKADCAERSALRPRAL